MSDVCHVGFLDATSAVILDACLREFVLRQLNSELFTFLDELRRRDFASEFYDDIYVDSDVVQLIEGIDTELSDAQIASQVHGSPDFESTILARLPPAGKLTTMRRYLVKLLSRADELGHLTSGWRHVTIICFFVYRFVIHPKVELSVDFFADLTVYLVFEEGSLSSYVDRQHTPVESEVRELFDALLGGVLGNVGIRRQR
jgi:hypothetical protein